MENLFVVFIQASLQQKMGIPKIPIEMVALLHLLLPSLRPISQLAVILSIRIIDVNHSILSCLLCSFLCKMREDKGMR